MSDGLYYPELNPKMLRDLEIIRQLAEEHPSYWLAAPYAGADMLLLQSWWGVKKVAAEKEPPREQEEDEDDADFLYAEVREVFKALREKRNAIDADGDALAYAKTAASLLEKLITMQERSLNLKRIGEFYSTVMSIMEEVLVPEQRKTVMDRLEKAKKGDL